MGVIRKRFLYCLAGAVLCAVAAVWFACHSLLNIAALFAAAAVVLAVSTFRAIQSWQAAKLITENPILNVGVASVALANAGGKSESSVDVVVSGFGILMDGRPYKFGHGGVDLTAVTIDQESIALSFGGADKQYSVRLLHGVAGKSDIDELSERLRYETGVVASLSGW